MSKVEEYTLLLTIQLMVWMQKAWTSYLLLWSFKRDIISVTTPMTWFGTNMNLKFVDIIIQNHLPYRNIKYILFDIFPSFMQA